MSVKEYLHHWQARLIRKLLRNYRTAKLHAMPSSIMVELTNRCNLHCIHCPREFDLSKEMEVGDMDFGLFKTVFDQSGATLTSIGLSGLGESLLYKDFFRVTEYIAEKRKNLPVFISINGTLLTEEVIKRLCRSGIRTVQVSVDGYDESTFSGIRRDIHFGRFVERVGKFAAAAEGIIDLHANVVLMRENIGHLSPFVDFIKSLGIRKINFTPINLTATDHRDSYYQIFAGVHFQEQVRQLRQKAQREDMIVTFYEPAMPCAYPWDPLYITWGGYVVPCCAKPFPKVLNFGNLHHRKFKEIMNGPGFRQFRQRLLSGDIPPFCQKCHNLYPHIAAAIRGSCS